MTVDPKPCNRSNRELSLSFDCSSKEEHLFSVLQNSYQISYRTFFKTDTVLALQYRLLHLCNLSSLIG